MASRAQLVRAGILGLLFLGAAAIPAAGLQAADAAPSKAPIHDPQSHWAFQPLRTIALPAPSSPGDSGHPVDRFIRARLATAGIRPAPKADRRALVRRAWFDLTGLPPRAEDVESFVADPDPSAFDRLLDRLLASPQYGERWARWWLDVARYADSNGQDENKAMANAWRYRDWVVRSFNKNLPFDRFITDQLAGDLMPSAMESESFDRMIATGFLVMGPKMLAEQDKPKLVMDIVDEQIDTVTRAFLGLTVGCARCHDHKYDPIPARDYYALAGIFKSTRTMENLDFVSKFHERSVTPRERLKLIEAQERLVDVRQKRLDTLIREANAALTNRLHAPLPKDPRPQYPENVRKELEVLEQERDSLKASLESRQLALAAQEGAITNVPVHLRGNHLTPGPEPVPRGFIQVLARTGGTATPPPNASGRLELARWLVQPGNPLTARVLVNRIWQAHFGEGLVRTPDNFGVRGETPSHPGLLDWLALEFIRSGWDLKRLHRVMLTSETWQQASTSTPEGLAADPENRLLSRFPKLRLEAEMIRDGLLAVSGQLDLEVGGSLVRWKNNEYVPRDDPSTFTSTRRTLYLPIVRDRVYDALSIFDFANPSVGVSKRTATTVAHQALFFMNSPLVKQAAQSLAATWSRPAGPASKETPDARTSRAAIVGAYQHILGRAPNEAEVERATRFLAGQESRAARNPGGPPGPATSQRWAALCQVLLASNEFIYRP